MSNLRDLSDTERYYWGLLASVETGVGAATLRQLQLWLDNNHLTAERFWLEAEKWAPLAGWKPPRLAAIQALRAQWPLTAWQEYLSEHQIRLVHVSDDGYPPLLRFIPDYPLVLFCRGRLEVLRTGGLAVVGARAVSAYGRAAIEALLGSQLTGVTIVSGMMNGADELAHRRALSLGLPTAAFLGYGLEYVWPSYLAGLKDEIIAQGGLLASEFAPWISPLPRRFPMRNRLVAGSSVATLVVEAAAKSGSLITANLALDYGREVMSVPGAIFSELSAGTLDLIRKGAVPVRQTADIIEVLASCQLSGIDLDFYRRLGQGVGNAPVGGKQPMRPAVTPVLSDPWQEKVWQLLVAKSWESEALCTQLDAGQEVMTALAMLELGGWARQDEAGRWERAKW